MSERDKRKLWKQWKKCSKTYCDKQKINNELSQHLEETTLPSSPSLNLPQLNLTLATLRVLSGKKIRRKNKDNLKTVIKDLKTENEKLKKK